MAHNFFWVANEFFGVRFSKFAQRTIHLENGCTQNIYALTLTRYIQQQQQQQNYTNPQ